MHTHRVIHRDIKPSNVLLLNDQYSNNYLYAETCDLLADNCLCVVSQSLQIWTFQVSLLVAESLKLPQAEQAPNSGLLPKSLILRPERPKRLHSILTFGKLAA